MASYLKPRRGAYSAISGTTLQSGEIFFETYSGIGTGKGKIMMGNNTAYKTQVGNKYYFLDLDTSPISFTTLGSDTTALDSLGGSLANNSNTQGTLPHLMRVVQRGFKNIEYRLAKLNSEKADKNHASGTTTYGVGTSSNYGHLKISDTYTYSLGVSDTAASQGAVYNAYDNCLKKSFVEIAATTTNGGNVTLSNSAKFSNYTILTFVLTTSSGANFQNTMVLPRSIFTNSTTRTLYIWMGGSRSRTNDLYWTIKYVSDTQFYSGFFIDSVSNYKGFIYAL